MKLSYVDNDVYEKICLLVQQQINQAVDSEAYCRTYSKDNIDYMLGFKDSAKKIMESILRLKHNIQPI